MSIVDKKVVSVDQKFVNLDGETLKDSLKIIRELITEYGEEAFFNISYENCSEGSMYVCVKRLETDAEYESRIVSEKHFALQQEARERKEFQRLKAKFGAD